MECKIDHGAFVSVRISKKSLPNVVRETMVEGDLQLDYVCSIRAPRRENK